MKNSNDTIGNRTRDLPACRAVPQSSAPPHAPNNNKNKNNKNENNKEKQNNNKNNKNNNNTHTNLSYVYARMGFEPEFPVDLDAFINNIHTYSASLQIICRVLLKILK
jgi:DNA replication protein DnaD